MDARESDHGRQLSDEISGEPSGFGAAFEDVLETKEKQLVLLNTQIAKLESGQLSMLQKYSLLAEQLKKKQRALVEREVEKQSLEKEAKQVTASAVLYQTKLEEENKKLKKKVICLLSTFSHDSKRLEACEQQLLQARSEVTLLQQERKTLIKEAKTSELNAETQARALACLRDRGRVKEMKTDMEGDAVKQVKLQHALETAGLQRLLQQQSTVLQRKLSHFRTKSYRLLTENAELDRKLQSAQLEDASSTMSYRHKYKLIETQLSDLVKQNERLLQGNREVTDSAQALTKNKASLTRRLRKVQVEKDTVSIENTAMKGSLLRLCGKAVASQQALEQMSTALSDKSQAIVDLKQDLRRVLPQGSSIPHSSVHSVDILNSAEQRGTIKNVTSDSPVLCAKEAQASTGCCNPVGLARLIVAFCNSLWRVLDPSTRAIYHETPVLLPLNGLFNGVEKLDIPAFWGGLSALFRCKGKYKRCPLTFELRENHLTDEDVQGLEALLLELAPSGVLFDLRQNNVTSAGLRSLVRCLQGVGVCEELTIMDCWRLSLKGWCSETKKVSVDIWA